MAQRSKQVAREKLIETSNLVLKGAIHEWHRGALIGSGGMAHVFEVTSPTYNEETCVVKIGQGHEIFSERGIFLKYLTKSAITQAETQMGHPICLPTLVDHGRIASTNLYFIVMEKFSPANFSRAAKSFLPWRHLVNDMLCALHYLHSCGLFHGDIKSENIMSRGSHYILMDFGITCSVDSVSAKKVKRENAVDGTLAYAGRDMHRTGFGPSFRADLENLIFCMYEWAGGKLPWVNETDPAVVYRWKTDFIDNYNKYLQHIDDCCIVQLIRDFINTIDHNSPATKIQFDKLMLKHDINKDHLTCMHDSKPHKPHNKTENFVTPAQHRSPKPPVKDLPLGPKKTDVKPKTCAKCSDFDALKKRLTKSSDIKDQAAIQALKYLNLW